MNHTPNPAEATVTHLSDYDPTFGLTADEVSRLREAARARHPAFNRDVAAQLAGNITVDETTQLAPVIPFPVRQSETDS